MRIKDDDGDDDEDYDDWQVVVTFSNLFGFMLQSCGKHLIPSSASFHHIPWFIQIWNNIHYILPEIQRL